MTRKNKILLIVAAVIVIGGIIGYKVYQEKVYRDLLAKPVAKIECEIVKPMIPGMQLTRDCFRVKATTKTNEQYYAREYTINMETVPLHGGTADIKINYFGLSQTLTMNIERQAIVYYEIGYPRREDVRATIYSNGDLEFTGNGQTLNFQNNDMPWKGQKYQYVFFYDDPQPQNIDYWFKNNENLLYCDPIPASIESMQEAFSGCKSLEKTPEYFQCRNLKIMSGAFSECYALKEIDVIPENVFYVNSMFKDCVSLKVTADMSKAHNIFNADSMYQNCTGLVDIASNQFPDSVRSMNSTFSGCTNIHRAVAFPPEIENVQSAYAGCISLEESAALPETITDAASCYANCRALRGDLWIHTDTRNISGILNGAARSGAVLYLTGNSGRLLEIQQNANNSFIQLRDPEAAVKQNEVMKRRLAGNA